MRPAKNTERQIKAIFAQGLRVTTRADLDQRILDNVMKTLDTSDNNKSAAIEPIHWRIIMRSRMTKLSAAAVIIVALTLGILVILGPSSIAWADVVEPLLNARTAVIDTIIGTGGDDMVIHDEIKGSRIRRTISNIEDTDIIIDLEQKKMLSLVHNEKTAVTIDLAGLDGVDNYLEKLQNLVTRLEKSPDFKVENQGRQDLNGTDCIVFVAQDGSQTITIWASIETASPIRIEYITPNMRAITDNMQFDVELDESRFSMDVPDGYTTQDTGIDFSNASESGFIETLRIWAEVIEDGQFPEGIGLEDVVKIGPKFEEGLKRAGYTKEEELEVGTRWGQGYVFIRFFKGQGKWHYAGKNVKLGDGSKAIFWYQPQDSETWRVIYGDLRIEDVATENLPQ
jgi:hypothetical protein